MVISNKVSPLDQEQYTYENTAESRRVTLIDKNGGNITSLNPLPVTPIGGTSDTAYHEFGSLTGLYNVEATIISYTVPANKTLIVTAINWGGEADGEFILYIDTVKTLVFRNSAANRTQFLTINDNNFIATTGQIVELKVTNVSHKQNSALFESTIIGGLA